MYVSTYVRMYVVTNVSTSHNKSHFTYTPDIIAVIILRCGINYLAKRIKEMCYGFFGK
jgi:broad-specificity NMP kinase